MKLTVTFFGHKEIPVTDSVQVKNELSDVLREILFGDKYSAYSDIEFLFGGYGEFDGYCFEMVSNFQSQPGCRKLKKVFITPYINESYKDRLKLIADKYDEIVFPPIENVPVKYAISRRNEWMVDSADIVIAYVTHGWGGAATTLRYAYRKMKEIYRLVSNYEVV